MNGSNDFWGPLGPYYDRIFPPGKPQLDFIGRVVTRMPHPARRLLDVGCATGGYALALADQGFEVTGIDLSPEMIRLARLKAAEWAARNGLTGNGGRRAASPGSQRLREPRFLVADMTNLEGLPVDEKTPFEAVICLGNTLAGLLSALELGTALGEMARVLGLGGRAVLQTVNYDRLAAAGEMKLPPITLRGGQPAGQGTAGARAEGGEGDLVFERLYLPRADGLVSFVATLHTPATGHVVSRVETVLRPVLRDELATIAKMAFHGEVEVYGDFLFTPWSQASPATVIVAHKDED